MVLKNVYPHGMISNDYFKDPFLNKKNDIKTQDPEDEDFSKWLPLDEYGTPYIKKKSVWPFSRKVGGHKKKHRKTNKKHRSKKTRKSSR